MRFWKPLQLLLAAGVLLGLVHVLIRQFAGFGDRFYEFIYERSDVQHVILFVASFVIVLLVDRCSYYFSNYAHYGALNQGRGKPPKALADQLEAVSRAHSRHGAAAAASRAEQVAQDHAQKIQKAYEAIGFLTASLPALGLFGTMLGLSNSLSVAFAGGHQGSVPVRPFVAALSTAMDTTVLAMACAVPLFGCAWLLGRLETELGTQYADHVRRQFGLDEIAAGDRTAGALQTELRALTRKLAAQAKLAFGQLLEDSANAYRETLEQVVAEVFAVQRKHDKEVVKKVAAEVANSLGQSVHRMGDLIERHNGRLAEGIIHQVGQLEEALRNRTPEEVVIRYRHNGRATMEEANAPV